jgi:hypothetical protein
MQNAQLNLNFRQRNNFLILSISQVFHETKNLFSGLRPAQAKKLARSYLKNKLGMVVHACNPNILGGRGRRIQIQGHLSKKQETLNEKQAESERTGMLLEVVQRLPKCSAPISLSSKRRSKELFCLSDIRI